MTKTYNGSCLCDSIRFTVTGEPFTYHVCHCENCKKSSGSAFMSNAFFKREQVAITKGKKHIKVYDDTKTTTGEVLPRSFCTSCGSSLFLGGEKKEGIVIVPTGLVDDEVDWVPRKEGFDKYRQHWLEVKTRPKTRSKL